jgi:hypothetical protein
MTWKANNPDNYTTFTIGSAAVNLKTVRTNIAGIISNTKAIGNVTAIHLHSASTDGVNSGILITLCNTQLSCPREFTPGSIALGFFFQLPVALLAPVPLLYLNIHTTAYPNGAIRAQLANQLTMNDVRTPSTPPDAPPSPTPSVVKSDASTSIVSFLSIFASVLAFSL